MIESFLAVAETGNFTKAAESGKLDLIFTIRDSVKNVKFERRSQSDCVHEQVAKADCECPLYAQKRENENLRIRTFLKCNADEEKLDRQFKSVPLEKVMAMENSMYYTIRKRRGIWR